MDSKLIPTATAAAADAATASREAAGVEVASGAEAEAALLDDAGGATRIKRLHAFGF